MAEIRNFGFVRHFRSDSSAHVLKYRRGRLDRHGRGLTFWFMPMSASVAEVPIDDRDLNFLFHGRSVDFQDVVAQGAIAYRIVDPVQLAERVDFTVDLHSGLHLHQPLDKLAAMLTELAQELTWDYVVKTPIRDILASGPREIRERMEVGMAGAETLTAMGLEVHAIRVSSVKPTAELEKALETPTREDIQRVADQATFARRARAVEKERAIAEAELQNQIELACREEKLIDQRGHNTRKQAAEKAEARRIETEAAAARRTVEAEAEARSVRLVQEAHNAGEREQMDIYRELPSRVIFGLAARELAGKLERIDHLNLSPDMFGSQLLSLIESGRRHLDGEGGERA
ncbi:MAG: SPFH domain-containing protein [Myxococcota bacterium]